MTALTSPRPRSGVLSGSILLVLTASGWFPSIAAAAIVYGESATLTGVRVVAPTGLATIEPDWQDASIAWDISPNGDGTFDYRYTLSGFDRPGASHFTLDLTDDAVGDPDAVIDPRLNGLPVPIEIGNKDGIVGALKLDDGADGVSVYTFTSNRAPVWGDLFVKGGSSSELTNTGFGDTGLMDVLHFIARPNGAGVPEPTSATILAGLVALARRRGR